MSSVHRRAFLMGATAVAVVGFDPISKSWACAQCPGLLSIPGLDGQLVTDPATLAAAADDFGHAVQRTPAAVLIPGSVEDIRKLVLFARSCGIKVAAARGVGESHSTQGQAQVEAGVVIDMSALNEIHEITAGSALVDAGVRWIDLLSETVPLGTSPPTLTDFIGLSVGGTLSVGGIGGQAFRSGLQVDNVLELQVVTGRGDLVTCSPAQHPVLFNAVRAGLGQFGIVVRARVRLVPVPPKVRVYSALYTTAATFMADQEMLIDDGRFDYVEGSVQPAEGGGWAFALEAVKYFTPGAEPDDAAMLAGLSFVPGTASSSDSDYFDFANRLAPVIDFLSQIGVWFFPHPWLNLFLPGPAAPAFVEEVLAQTTLDDTGQGPILLYPFKRSKVTAPFVSLPDTPHVFIFSLLRTAIPPIPEQIDLLVDENRAIFEAARDIGGKRYAIDSVPMSHADWQQQLSPHWLGFVAAKLLFDPDNVLTPGQQIFT